METGLRINDIINMRVRAHNEFYINEEFMSSLCNKIKHIQSYKYDSENNSLTIRLSDMDLNYDRGSEFERLLIESLPNEFAPYIKKGVFFNTLKFDSLYYIIML